MQFLVVDDSQTMRRIVINALKSFGYKSFGEAENGEQAITILGMEPVNFIISEWDMPVMSGLEFTNFIRSDEKYNHIPILIVSKSGLKKDIVDALNAKVNNYLVKPFTPKTLKDKIDTVLSSTGTIL